MLDAELLQVINQIPGAIEKAFTAFIERHPGHANQKTHGNRFGAGQAKESLRRLKDDKGAREAYKTAARGRGQGSGSTDTYSGEPQVSRVRDIKSGYGETKGQTLSREFDVTRKHSSGLQGKVVGAKWTSANNKWSISDLSGKEITTAPDLKTAKTTAVNIARKIYKV